MQEAAKAEPMCKVDGELYSCKCAGFSPLLFPTELYEFPLAVVEGKAVFVGDELFYGDSAVTICEDNSVRFIKMQSTQSPIFWHLMSWNPPKPKTVMVELLREDAESLGDCWKDSHFKEGARRVSDAARKAVEAK